MKGRLYALKLNLTQLLVYQKRVSENQPLSVMYI